jgi:hypothetical protein
MPADDGGAMARSGGQVREHQVSYLPHPHPSSLTQEKVTAGDTLSRTSSSASSRSDFGPFSAIRSFDDADPRELAGEGWDSDADWGYGSPEPGYADVDGRAGTKRNRRADPTSNVAPRKSKRLLESSALRHTFGPPTHSQALRAREGATGESGQSTASRKAKQRRRKDSTSDVAPLRRSTRRRDHRAPGNNLGSPSDPQDLEEKEGATGEREQSTANPIEVRSLLPTPAEEALIDGGTRTRSSSPPSSRSDFGPFSAIRSFDDADPRELAGEGWDSDADWGFGGFEPRDSEVDGRDTEKPRRQKDSAATAAPLRKSKRHRDPGTLGSILRLPSDSHDLGVKEGVNGIGRQSTASPTDARPFSPIPADRSLGGRKRPLLASDSFSKGGHQPGASSSHPVRSRPGKRGCSAPSLSPGGQ